MLLAALCCDACCGAVNSGAGVLGTVSVLDYFPPLRRSHSFFLLNLLRVVGVVLVLFLDEPSTEVWFFEAGVVVWAVGQLVPHCCAGARCSQVSL